MKTEFRIRGLNATANLRRWLEQSLNRLHRLIKVSAATVVIEQHREKTPAFRVFVQLAVPGPDIHAEAREHTLEAVWLKVIAALRKQVDQRESRRRARLKSKRQMPLSTSRWGASPAGVRA